MALTNTIFNYKVASVIDTPVTSIINGLNHTKTNLVPIAFADTYSQNADSGLVLPITIGNNLNTYSSYVDYNTQGGILDSKDTNKYWIANSRFASYDASDTTEPLILCAQIEVDSNGRQYCEVINATPTLFNKGNCAKIIYQEDAFLYVLTSNATANKEDSSNTTLYKFRKQGTSLVVEYTNTFNYPYINLLKVENGKLYLIATGANNSGSQNRLYVTLIGWNISANTFSTSQLQLSTTYDMQPLFCSKINEDNEFYISTLYNKVCYKVLLDSSTGIITGVPLDVDYDNTTVTTTPSVFVYQCSSARHHFEYDINSEKYIAFVTHNKYINSQAISKGTGIQLYKVNGTTLNRVQTIEVDCLSVHETNNCIMLGTRSGIEVWGLDKQAKQFIKRSVVDIIPRQWGFDMDSRLWIMDSGNQIWRYNYNQPVNTIYHFEKERYPLTEDPVQSYIEIGITNYLGEPLNMTVTIIAEGNFVFENGLKELTLPLSAEQYMQVPIYITGAGIYKLRLK